MRQESKFICEARSDDGPLGPQTEGIIKFALVQLKEAKRTTPSELTDSVGLLIDQS